MAVVTMRQLLESGVHFGHQTRRWNPKMKRFILTERNGIYIIDLEQTIADIDIAFDFVKETVAHGGTILFVGTKKQLKAIVKEVAESVEMPYVTERWVGGTLTNVETVNRQIKKLKDLERRMKSGELEARYSKLEVQRFQEEIETLNIRYGGIKEMTDQPSLVIVTDACEDKNAIKEAKTLNIPVIAICDTNVDPSDIDFVIPANDDSTKTEKLILGYFVEAIKQAKK